MKRLAAVAAAISLALTVTPIAGASPGWLDRGSDGGHNTWTGSKNDDPIKFPGQPGASHLHDFFCVPTDAFSTPASLQAGPTVCPNDNAAYWVMALYKDGVKIDPTGSTVREQIYYRDNNLSSVYTIHPFPDGFKMIVGNSAATTQAEANAINPSSGIGAKVPTEQYWGCSDNSEPAKEPTPINCSTGIISMHVGFPNCWNGVKVDGDQIAAGTLRWPSSGSCPAGFGIALPRLIERFEYKVGTSSSGITLASGNVYSIHADFMNGWKTSNLSYLVDHCLNANVDCGTNPFVP